MAYLRLHVGAHCLYDDCFMKWSVYYTLARNVDWGCWRTHNTLVPVMYERNTSHTHTSVWNKLRELHRKCLRRHGAQYSGDYQRVHITD